MTWRLIPRFFPRNHFFHRVSAEKSDAINGSTNLPIGVSTHAAYAGCNTKQSFLPFDEKEGFFTGKQRTGFIRPGCGGEVIAEGSDMRVMYRVQTFRFHANGDRIQDDEES